MDGILLPSYLGLWLFALIQFILLLALARQVGRILLRVEPSAGAAVTNSGPQIGDVLSIATIQDAHDRSIPIIEGESATLLVFTTPGCSSCDGVYPALKALARPDDLRILVVSGTEGPANERIARDLQKERIPYIVAPSLPKMLGILSPPYAVLIDKERRVLTKGVVNHLLHLESLINARQHGVATANEFEALHQQMHHAHSIPIEPRPSA
jgi:methylamine dehydrogenase accessory protein MauD